jgi:acyl-CoA dehydrogenase
LSAIELPADIIEFRERALEFLRTNVHPLEQQVAETGVLDLKEYETLRKRAREELPLPERYVSTGGPGAPEVPMVVLVAIEEIGGHATNGLGVIPRAKGRDVFEMIATPFQRETYVEPTVRGEIRNAWAITEPGSAGSDVTGIAATAIRDGDGWMLNGEKWFVTGGDRAAYFLVLVWAGGEQSLFIVDRDAPGPQPAAVPSAPPPAR